MNSLAQVIDFFQTISPTFWGVVVGSFFSLGGVVLSNRASNKRLQAQHSNERELRNQDRDLELRKDIYLAATEAISAGLMSVANLADLETPHDKIIKGYVEKAPAIAKIQIIGNENTLIAIFNVSNELSKAHLQLGTKRIPLVSMKEQLAHLDEQVVRFGEKRDQMLELMRQYNIEGSGDERRWETINDSFKFEQQQISQALEQKKELGAKLLTDLLVYLEECVGEITRIGRLVVPAVIAVRKELHLPIDEPTYRRIVEESYAKQTANVTQLLEETRTMAKVLFDPAQNGSEEASVT